MPPPTWSHRVRVKRAALAALVPPEWRLSTIPSPEEAANVIDWPGNLLSREEITITETAPLATLANMHAGIWSAEEVTRAFCHRASIAHQLVNCLTEILFNEAIAIAQQLDRYLQETGTLRGPLHGLPISFMDRFRIAGAETSSGFVAWLGTKETSESESLIVRHMRKLGAIPFCKTCVPQSMMLGNTTNNIYGSTANPFVRSLSAGGAAGGKAAAPSCLVCLIDSAQEKAPCLQ
jgi:amidase